MIKSFNIGPSDAEIFDLEMKNTPNSLVRVHSPDCGHCTAMKPEWDKLCSNMVDNFKSNKGNMGIFDVNYGALSNIDRKNTEQ